MSQIVKPVMLDETGQVTNTRLTELGGKVDGLGTKIDNHKTETASKLQDISTTMTNNTAATGQKLDRADYQRLAGSCFACDDVESAGKLQIELRHQRQISDMK